MKRPKTLALLLICSWAGAHQLTFSRVDVRLEPSATEIMVQLPVAALLHEQPSPLPIGTTAQTLRDDPLPEGVQTALEALLTTRLQLVSGGKPLSLTVEGVRATGEEVNLNITASPVSGTLNVRANLFPEDALHKVFVNVFRADALVGQYALDRQNASFALRTPERPLGSVIVTFVREGVHHIFIGPDHILFVLALILLGGKLASQFRVITAFTVAHSITLTLATLNLVQLPSRLVESLIALSIVVVGLHDLRQLRRTRALSAGRDPRVLFAFAFGLVHGFGFASVLVDLELPQRALAWSLAAFNVGVEVGQVAVILLAAPLLSTLRRYAPPRLTRDLLTSTACAVVIAGSFWFWQRAVGI